MRTRIKYLATRNNQKNRNKQEQTTQASRILSSRRKKWINSLVGLVCTSIADPLLANETSSRSTVLFPLLPPPILPAFSPPQRHVCTCPALPLGAGRVWHPGSGCKQSVSGINLQLSANTGISFYRLLRRAGSAGPQDYIYRSLGQFTRPLNALE